MIVNRKSYIENSSVEPPLTEHELAALQQLSKGFDPDQLEADADTIYTALAEAIASEGEDVKNRKHPNGEECEAEQGNCPILDKNQPASYPREWKPLSLSKRMTPGDARTALHKGVTATDPLGNAVTLDDSIVNHWEQEGKSKEDIERRLSYLPVIEKSIKHPAEIWEQEDGTRVYMAAYNTLDAGRIYPLSFTVSKDSSKIRTYFPNEGNIQAKRKGRLIYQATAAPDA